MSLPQRGLDAALTLVVSGPGLARPEQLWLAQQAQRLHAALCTVLVTLQDCETLLRELDAEPELLVDVAAIQATARAIMVDAEARGTPCP
jgi:hypothetical protein